MNKIQQMEEDLRQAKENIAAVQREARDKLEPIYSYHTTVTKHDGIRIIGTLQNKPSFDAHMKEYGSIINMPSEKTVGIEHIYTVDGWLIRLGGGWAQPQLPYGYDGIKITMVEWNNIKHGFYPARLYKDVYKK